MSRDFENDNNFLDEDSSEGEYEHEQSIYSGVSITLPTFKKLKMSHIYDPSNIADYTTMEELDQTLQNARKGLMLLTDKINEYERLERGCKVNLDRAWRREYLGSSEKTDASKKARASLKCEELENEWITNDQLKAELIRASYTMRQEIQALTTIANNLRQQLKTF